MLDTRELGFMIPEILIPAPGVDLSKWAVVACDQFTSQPEYWREVEKIVGTSASALHIMLPEIYLGQDGLKERIAGMKETMSRYLDDGVLVAAPPGIMLVLRHIGKKVRKGIMLAIDLEAYDYDIEKKPMIRATEETVLSRIPPRVMIRKGAAVEMPHIMLLMDDPGDEAIGGLYIQRNSLRKVYGFDLMMGGGRIEGYLASGQKYVDEAVSAISRLRRRDNMLFCVGDGNHSLATAKTIWDEAKQHLSEAERADHPLRFALCEVINLRDKAVEFKPIHRLITGVNPAACAQFVSERLMERGRNPKLVFTRWNASTQPEAEGSFTIPFLYRDGAGRISIQNPVHPLAVGEVQDIFEEFLEKNPQASIDYIHGDEAFTELARGYDSIGFYFDALKKSEFFDLVVKCGVLPKKTFSLGEAEEKRYYMECRLLTYADYDEDANAKEGKV